MWSDRSPGTSLKKRLRVARSRFDERARQVRAASDAWKSRAKLAWSGSANGLFIDCGSNVGQGFAWFRRYFPLDHYDYILVEPNPNCVAELRSTCAGLRGNIRLLEQAAGTAAGEVDFFGLTESEWGNTNQGGSILPEHNSRLYTSDRAGAIKVETFSLADLIAESQATYPSVLLKLDVEGAEYEVLDDLLNRRVHLGLDVAYVEFHSRYMLEPDRTHYRERETELIRRFKRDGVPLRLWK